MRSLSRMQTCLAAVFLALFSVALQAQPALECIIEPVTITADFEQFKYDPMPFEVTAHVVNTGTESTLGVSAVIRFEPELFLAGDDAPGAYTKEVDPILLEPGDTGTVSWTLSHLVSNTVRSYAVSVQAASGQADTSACETEVVIPALGEPSLRVSCQTPASLIFNENMDEYVPNPFSATVTAINLGDIPADSVSVFLSLPEGIEFDPPGQSPGGYFGTLEPYNAGNPIPSKTWTVRWTKRYRQDATPEFCWVAGGINSASGMPLDSVSSCCETYVPGLKPYYKCTLTMPDTIYYIDGAYELNPFTVEYTIENTSRQLGTIERVVCYFPNDGITLDPSVPGNSRDKTIDTEMYPGDDTTFVWVFNVEERDEPRRVQIQIVAFDDEGNPIACDKTVYIEPVTSTAVGGPPPTPRFSLAQNYPNPFSSRTDIVYTMARGAEVRMTVHDILGREVAELVDGSRSAGKHTAEFNAQNLPGGVYILRMHAAGYAGTRVMHVKR